MCRCQCGLVGPGLVVLLAVGFGLFTQSPRARSFPICNLFRANKFEHSSIPNLSNRVAIVTGGNTGLGRSTVKHLLRQGAHVIVAVRSQKRGEAAVTEIRKEGIQGGRAEVMVLDLSSLKSVREFSKNFLALGIPLHILVLNAGIMATEYGLTVDGIEQQFAVNHVAHSLLTKLLLDLLKTSAPSRIVSVSSGAHYNAPEHGVGLNLNAINNETGYNKLSWYGQSKLANILFTQELDERLVGHEVYANVIHPGFVQTELIRYIEDSMPPMLRPLINVFYLLAYDVETGGLTQLYTATSPEIEEKNIRGKYFVPVAVQAETSLLGKNETLQKALWDFTETLIQEEV